MVSTGRVVSSSYSKVPFQTRTPWTRLAALSTAADWKLQKTTLKRRQPRTTRVRG
jgi:hypothetical protein